MVVVAEQVSVALVVERTSQAEQGVERMSQVESGVGRTSQAAQGEEHKSQVWRVSAGCKYFDRSMALGCDQVDLANIDCSAFSQRILLWSKSPTLIQLPRLYCLGCTVRCDVAQVDNRLRVQSNVLTVNCKKDKRREKNMMNVGLNCMTINIKASGGKFIINRGESRSVSARSRSTL